MDEVLERLAYWRSQGHRAALATVVRTSGSTPRSEGAKLLVRADRELIGSVSGGCVEGDVTLHALDVLQTGLPRLVPYGISDEAGIAVGLACGGSIDVLIQPATGSTPYDLIPGLIERETSAAVATVIRPERLLGSQCLWRDGELVGTLGSADLDNTVRRRAPELVSQGVSRCVVPQQDGEEAEVFVDVYPSPPTLLIFGGVHIAIALTRFAKALGFRVKVIDPRGVFATAERFAEADELHIEWPQTYLEREAIKASDYVVVLTHDPKLDEPAIEAALTSEARYVGAIGSRQTNRVRRARLAGHGIAEADLERLHAPIGLDIGSRSPEEIALAIMAEIVATRRGKRAASLKDAQ